MAEFINKLIFYNKTKSDRKLISSKSKSIKIIIFNKKQIFLDFIQEGQSNSDQIFKVFSTIVMIILMKWLI